jgi:hypothetical protein
MGRCPDDLSEPGPGKEEPKGDGDDPSQKNNKDIITRKEAPEYFKRGPAEGGGQPDAFELIAPNQLGQVIEDQDEGIAEEQLIEQGGGIYALDENSFEDDPKHPHAYGCQKGNDSKIPVKREEGVGKIGP